MEEKPYQEYYLDVRKQKSANKVLVWFVCVCAIIFVLFFTINHFFEQKYTYITVCGESMQPTLNPNGVVELYQDNGKIKEGTFQDGAYMVNTDDITYGDIIVIEKTYSSPNKTVVKRALAFEGDYITIAKVEVEEEIYEFRFMIVRAGSSAVEVVKEDYIKSYRVWTDIYSPSKSQIPQDEETSEIVYESEFFETFVRLKYESKLFTVDQLGGSEAKFFKVPNDSVFFMGDNRTNSSDSRSLGTGLMSNVPGKIIKIVRNGVHYKGNNFHSFYRFGAFLELIWQEFLRFFGVNI
ncbi:MAG: signal peptidase I [Clostridia bacterium]|nr:signal peptidase I [Clostridia bacterium]